MSTPHPPGAPKSTSGWWPALAAIGLVTLGSGAIWASARPSTGTAPAAAVASSEFGQHYRGLVSRRDAARVPTMMQTMSSAAHFHPQLKLYVDGVGVAVPANIGIDPAVDSMQMAGLHTHDDSGTIHVEGMGAATLGQFMAVWGVPLSAHRLGRHRAGSGNVVQMWADGRRSTAFGDLALVDRQRIVLAYGPARATPPGG